MHSQSRGNKRIFAAAMDSANDKVEGAKLKNEELIKPICNNEHANVTENQNMALNIPVDHMVSYYACLVPSLSLLFCKSFQSSNLKPFRVFADFSFLIRTCAEKLNRMKNNAAPLSCDLGNLWQFY